MRPVKQVKVISSQLEILEEFKTQLESILDYTKNVIQKGNSWIKEENNETFLEMNKFLIHETCECINQCRDITKDKSEECQPHSDLQEQDISDQRTKSVASLKSSLPPEFYFRDGNEYKQLIEKCQEMEKTIILYSKKVQKFENKFQEHKKETKETISKEKNKYKIKFDEIKDEFHKASSFMSCLETQNEDVINKIKEHDKQMSSFIETLHSVQEQIKENEQKSETFMKQQKSTETSFSLRLDEVMKDILQNAESINKLKSDSETLSNVVNELAKNFDTIISNLQEKITHIEDNFKTMENSCKETDGSNKRKLDDICNKIQSTDLQGKILEISSQVDKISQQLTLSRQQAGFYAQASGPMNVQMDLKKDQIVTSFGCDVNNVGNHYDPTKGIFTAPCDGLYLCSLTLRFEIGENVQFAIRVKESMQEVYKCYLQTSTIMSNASATILLSLKQNDQVYIASGYNYQQVKLHVCSYFMCTLITKD